jgi:hypothetical protein
MVVPWTVRHGARRRLKMVRAALEPLESRTLLNAQTINLDGGDPIALDQPTIHALLTSNGTMLTGDGPDGEPGYYDIEGFLDTGTSGLLIDSATAASFGVNQTTSNGQIVTYNDSGVAGGEGFGISDPLTISLAPSTADNDTRGGGLGDLLDFGNGPPLPSEYTQTFNNLRLQISRDAVDPLLGGIDIFGMPVMQNKVVYIDPTPANNNSTLSTYIYNPGDPAIPSTNLHVKLTYASFDQFTSLTPSGAPGPAEMDNPFIGPNPLAPLSAKKPFDNTQPVTMTFGDSDPASASGSFLFDTGAQASFISLAEAAKLGVHYAPGSYNSDDPELVDANGDPLVNQFAIPIGGIGGTVNAAGFYLNTLNIPTIEGPSIQFSEAPVLVTDVTVTNPNTQQSLTLDGDFGVNFMVATTDLDGFDTVDSPFDKITFDQANGILGLDDPNVSVIPWPTASSSAGDLTTAGGSTYTFTVNYAATGGQTLTAATIDSNNILVTGPHGFSQLATEVSVNQNGSGSPTTVTYRINAPAGGWDIANDGDYTINVQPNQVGDSAGDFVRSQPLAAFSIAITPASIPSTGGADTYYVRIDPASIYTEVYVNTVSSGDPTYLFVPTAIPTMLISGAGGNDAATVDFSVGDPLPNGGLSFDGGTGVNSISFIGTNTNDNLTIDGSQVTFGDIPISYANTQSITVDGGFGNDTVEQLAQPSAALTFTGIGQDTLIVDAGSFTFSGNPAIDTSNLTVFDFSTVTFAAAAAGSGLTAQTLAALNLGPGAIAQLANPASHSDRTVLVLGNLTESSTSTLDLSKNDMIVRNGNLPNLARRLKTGRNAGHAYWKGSGIISSAAAADTRFLTTLGIRPSPGTVFDGVPTSINDVLVKYTYYGDADLNGTVNGADYQQIDSGFGIHLTGWSNGDFNYDGVVDGTDYSLLDNTFNQVGATGASPLAIVATPEVVKTFATTPLANPAPIGTPATFPELSSSQQISELLDGWETNHHPILFA